MGKATLLHAEYHRDIKKSVKPRMFRHYYDMVMLDQNGVTDEALQDTKLLADVIKNKNTYFPDKKAKYEDAKIGMLMLYPNEVFLDPLRQDHDKMKEMYFGEMPKFDEIITKIKRIESKINTSLKQGRSQT